MTDKPTLLPLHITTRAQTPHPRARHGLFIAGSQSRVQMRVQSAPRTRSREDALAREQAECAITVPFSRLLYDYADRKLPYRRRTGEPTRQLHWGQRKLLLSEVEFLTLHGDASDTVVYAGAADGLHQMLLAGELFPNHKFILYDPREFAPALENVHTRPPNVTLKHQYFTSADAAAWACTVDSTDGAYSTAGERVRVKGAGVLFISDIRRTPEGWKDAAVDETNAADLEQEFSALVAEDMAFQQDWHIAMRPAWSMLKMRLPYTAGQTEYLDGQVYTQVWAPSSSTEARLVCKGVGDRANVRAPMRIYDNTEYEQIFYRFNLCTRWQPFELPYALAYANAPASYDMRGEIHIWEQYLIHVRGLDPADTAAIRAGILELQGKFDRLSGKSFSEQQTRHATKHAAKSTKLDAQ